MSTDPFRSEGPASPSPSPFDQAHRVLASVESKHGLHALLAFSDLRENIRKCRPSPGSPSAERLVQAESFVLQQLLNLIAARALALTRADIVVVALIEEEEFVCRAVCGSESVPPNTRLNQASRFLQDALRSGKALRCDDTQIDPRTQHDFARLLRARSTILVPLRGETQNVGVIQAVSGAPRAFTDRDTRCLDLLAELVLAALKPDDQDRRLEWLSDIASEILKGDSSASELPPKLSIKKPESAFSLPLSERHGWAPTTPEIAINPALFPASLWPESVSEIPSASSALAHPQLEIKLAGTQSRAELAMHSTTELAPCLPTTESPAPEKSTPERLSDMGESTSETIWKPASALPEPAFLSEPASTLRSRPGLSRFGLNFALVAVFVIALFSAGVWLGMHVHAHDSQTASRASTDVHAAKTSTMPDAGDRSQSANNLDAPLAASSENVAALPKITGLRHWSSPGGSTVVIDMEDQANYEVHRLMSPERIYFDLHDTNLPSDLEGKTIDIDDASLTRVRIAQPVAGLTRVVLDTKDGSNFSVSMETSPYRLVVELRDTPAAAATHPADATTGRQATVASLTPVPASPLPARAGKFRIVLDAGHGGWDLGTVGRQGLLEKNLVLDVAERLGKLLQTRSGADVVFTRTSDDYVSLDQRADLANQAQADLFVSIHANYSTSTTARGVETFYTNLFSAPGLKELEKRPDGASPMPATLSPAGLREKTEDSRRLASTIQRSLYATLAANNPGIRDRGIKDATFVVLTGTTMPSILTEISFVSSPTDEQNLQSDKYRQQIAEALYKGISSYQQSSAKTKMAQLHPSGSGR